GRAGAKGMKRGTPAPYFRKPGGTSVRAPGGRRADSAFLSANGSRPKPRPADKTALSALQLHRPDVGRTAPSCPPMVPDRSRVRRTKQRCPPYSCTDRMYGGQGFPVRRWFPDRNRVRRTKQRSPPYSLSILSRT